MKSKSITTLIITILSLLIVSAGEITAESEGEDKGSTFTITLPVTQEI